MLDLLKEFLGSPYVIYALYVYLFLLITYCIYSILNYFKYYSNVKNNIYTMYKKMSEDDRIRLERERRERDIHGLVEKHDFLDRINSELIYSGLREKYTWITTELYIMINIILMALSFLLATVLSNIFIGLIVVIIIFLVNRFIIMFLGNRRNRHTEEAMLQLMNIIDNFSKSSDDIVTIIEHTSRYIPEPLSGSLYRCAVKARNSGDASGALDDLRDEVKNKYFKVMIKSLEISSRHTAEYSSIIQDCRDSYHIYLKNEKEKQAMRVNGVAEIAVMIGIGLLTMFWLGIMTNNTSIVNALLQNGIVGKVILVYAVVAILTSLYMIIEVMKEV